MKIIPGADVGKQVKDATHVRVILNMNITIGELLMWKDTEAVLYLYRNSLGESTLEGFDTIESFTKWLNKQIKGGHNIHFV